MVARELRIANNKTAHFHFKECYAIMIAAMWMLLNDIVAVGVVLVIIIIIIIIISAKGSGEGGRRKESSSGCCIYDARPACAVASTPCGLNL